jgi:glycerol kinase
VSSGKVLVIDIGTSSVRSAIVDADGIVSHVVQEAVLPSSPDAGLVELDATVLGAAALSTATAVIDQAGGISAVGIANQRATTVVWNKHTGVPIGPALGWQDLRTVVSCLILQGEGLRLAPNSSATKIQWLLDTFDPERSQADDLLFGTIDTWIIWLLSQGATHVTDLTNAAVTGLLDMNGTGWDERALGILKIPQAMMPSIVDSSGMLAAATALPGAPPITGIAGDQQASLIGQGCTVPGIAKITFGTGGMLDMVTSATRPSSAVRGEAGTYPIAAWQRDGVAMWGLEAIMLSAGSCVEWLRDDLGILESAAESADVAAACSTSDGVVFVPALLGLGTPTWDFGARGLLLGLTRGSGRSQITRAVLEGVAQRGRDLVDAAEADSGIELPALRIDGGMSANPIFVEALANATGRPIELSRELEATTLGAGLLAGIELGWFADVAEINATWIPRDVVEPTHDNATRDAARALFLEARSRAEKTIPDLSGVTF